MSIINDALKKANDERNPANPSSRAIRWIGLIIILVGLIVSAYFMSKIIPIPSPKDAVVEQTPPAQKSKSLEDASKTMSVRNKLLNDVSDITNVSQEAPQRAELLFNLTGIIRGEGKLLAVINNNIVEEGQTIGGMRVKKIYNDHVVLSNDDEEYIITLK